MRLRFSAILAYLYFDRRGTVALILTRHIIQSHRRNLAFLHSTINPFQKRIYSMGINQDKKPLPRRSSRLRQARDIYSNLHSGAEHDHEAKVKETQSRKATSQRFKRKHITTTTEVADEDLKNSQKENLLLLDLGNLVKGRLVKRPSAQVRSPYVSDVMIVNENGDDVETVQAHSPALDVGGLCVPSTTVFMKERPPGGKTSHSIELLLAPAPNKAVVEGDDGILVGIHPSLGEKLAEEALKKGLLRDAIGLGQAFEIPSSRKKKHEKEEDKLEPKGITLRRQCTYGDSRLDFELTDHSVDSNGKPKPRTLVEVKNVVCSDYAAHLAPEKTGPNHCVITSDAEKYSRTAIFPWGRVGQKFEGKKVVSERAIKHMINLGNLTSKDDSLNGVVLFVINRSDCKLMRACHEACPVFASTIKTTAEKGCIVTSFRVRWTRDGKAYFDGIVPVSL